MRFKDFLLSEEPGLPTPEILSRSDAVEFIQAHCKQAVTNPIPLFRGSTITDPHILDLAGAFRRSKDNSNAVNILFDHLNPAQEPRTKSIIMSTNRIMASAFGRLMGVLPVDYAKLSIATEDFIDMEINPHFGGKRRRFTVAGFGRFLDDAIFHSKVRSYEDVKSTFLSRTEEQIADSSNHLIDIGQGFSMRTDFFGGDSVEEIWTQIEKAISELPIADQSIHDKDLGKGLKHPELWTSSKCIIVPMDLFKEVREEDENEDEV